MALRCVVYGCSKKEDEVKRILSTKFPSTVTQDRERKWNSLLNGSRKYLIPSKYSVVCSMHRKEDFTRTYSFDQQCYQERLKRVEIGV